MHDQSVGKAPEALIRYLKEQESKDLLRFITCGSVDDGKSTLIGRLLFDSKMIFEDQLASLEKDSRKMGTTGQDIDLALLLDGLEAEREQGITIDVAYRFFATDKRRFIVADTPGHEQYTRNMATGASTADAAIILVDARKGLLTQTRRHSYICSLLGVRHIILAVNKMDLVDYSQTVFDQIRADYEAFAKTIGYDHVSCLPLSALKGENVLQRTAALDWFNGPTLLAKLETIPVADADDTGPFRLPVQWVNRPNLDFRGFSGTIAAGRVAVGDPVVVLPSAKNSRVSSIVTFDGTRESASIGEAITLTLEDEIDISRGDVICHSENRAGLSDQFEAKIVWMADEPLIPGRPYLLKSGARTVSMVVTRLKYSINVNSLEQAATKRLELNDIGIANISLDQQIAFDPYHDNHETGSFIIIDKMTNGTVGAGMIDFGLRRATNIHWQAVDVNKAARAAMKAQKPAVLWFTGLSGSGKSTIANLVEKRLHAAGQHTYMLDGDNIRHGLNKDLGFTEVDRVENIRRVAEVARLMADAGLIVLVSFISPFRSERKMARDLLPEDEFHEVFVDTPIALCEQRDPKGLYKKARMGEIKNFTGIDSPYEPPLASELSLETAHASAEECAEKVIDYLDQLKD
ncbi:MULTISPECIES: sulfate adenylyltransferase subunit CysN [unclassified Iodidimonas]|jgi:bifunctional enzyme CysN/CysC|uniref:sulfate adenylyltransferase subunit CysN n=1 Tax=unclassified Iodidimonas TaxID=2626145 RepID=UPI0024822229|nr:MULTISPECIES: sulfate adenylyltransferase subunit CysN [unclassified Iodidimonas]